MNEHETIAPVKRNEWTAFGGLSSEHQKFLRLNELHVETRLANNLWVSKRFGTPFYLSSVYRIAQDYVAEIKTPEPVRHLHCPKCKTLLEVTVSKGSGGR